MNRYWREDELGTDAGSKAEGGFGGSRVTPDQSADPITDGTCAEAQEATGCDCIIQSMTRHISTDIKKLAAT